MCKFTKEDINDAIRHFKFRRDESKKDADRCDIPKFVKKAYLDGVRRYQIAISAMEEYKDKYYGEEWR
jgi:hypothetical protein